MVPLNIDLISPGNPRPPGVSKIPHCGGQRQTAMPEEVSPGVLEYWKQICFALILCWLGKQYLLFHNMQIDSLASENVQAFPGCKMFRCHSCSCFSITPTRHYSINALSLQAYELPMGADQSPVLPPGRRPYGWRLGGDSLLMC